MPRLRPLLPRLPAARTVRRLILPPTTPRGQREPRRAAQALSHLRHAVTTLHQLHFEIMGGGGKCRSSCPAPKTVYPDSVPPHLSVAATSNQGRVLRALRCSERAGAGWGLCARTLRLVTQPLFTDTMRLIDRCILLRLWRAPWNEEGMKLQGPQEMARKRH